MKIALKWSCGEGEPNSSFAQLSTAVVVSRNSKIEVSRLSWSIHLKNLHFKNWDFFFILFKFLAHKFKRIGIFSQFALFAIFRVRLFDWFSNAFRALPYPKKVFQYSPSFTLLDSWPRLILSLSRSSIGFSLVRWIWFSIGDCLDTQYMLLKI